MIEAVYTISEREFAEAQKLWCTQAVRKLPGHFILQGVLLSFLVLIVLSVPYLPFWLAMSFSGCMAIFAGLCFWRKKALVKSQYAQMEDRLRSVSVRIDDDGYHDYKQDSGSGWIAWKQFSGWREGSQVFVLGISMNFLTIPKAPLSVDQQNELRTRLQQIGQLNHPHLA
jgi:hypothetical protein